MVVWQAGGWLLARQLDADSLEATAMSEVRSVPSVQPTPLPVGRGGLKVPQHAAGGGEGAVPYVQCTCSEPGGGEPNDTEGCSVHGTHAWEIEPHMEPSDADILIVDDDHEALQHILSIAEHLWDQIEPGEERVLKIRRRKV